jgi:hypothetical protein
MTKESTARLTLVGTFHRDPEGRKKLASLLERLQPDALTLEVSPYAVAFRLRRGPLLLGRLATILDRLAVENGRDATELASHPETSAIRALLALPFEYLAAAEYTAAAGIPFSLIDSSLVSARKLRRVERELITPGNLGILWTLPAAPPVKESPAVARRMVLGDPGEAVRQAFLAGRRGTEGVGPRDRHLGREIRRRLENLPGGHLVHVGGWVHLVEDEQGETLFSLLRDLEPERVLL